MPVTDNSFISRNSSLKKQELAYLQKSVSKKENPNKKLAVIILAAGLGKRMKSPDKPKVMFEIMGKPMIEYVVELALSVNADLIIPVVGHHRQQVIDFINNRFPEGNIKFVIQEQQLGTGHAVMQSEKILDNLNGEILILSGDVPLLSTETLKKLIQSHYHGSYIASLLTTKVQDPSGYGRIIRDEKGRFLKIVEEKDSSEDEKKINEINPAIYIVNSVTLFECLKKITPENKQKEYYLTDIFHFIPKDKIGTVMTENELEVTGINSLEQLNQIEQILSSYNKS